MATVDELVVEIKSESAQMRKDLTALTKKLSGTKKSTDSLKSSIKRLALSYVSFQAVKGVTKSLVETITTFEQLEASLKTVTGSLGAAQGAFSNLQDFAATTPFQLEEVVGAFIKLKALGLDPSKEALTSFGNTASAMGKSLNQVIEAVADASTFEFERLKEFGIRARQQTDSVIFTFQGVKTEVGKSSAEIQKFLRNIGDVNFGGAMKEQADTLNVAISNSSDNISKLAKAIGDAGFKEIALDVVSAFSDITKAATKFFEGNTTDKKVDIVSKQVDNLRKQKSLLEEKVKEGGLFTFFNESSLDSVNRRLDDRTKKLSSLLETLKTEKSSKVDNGGQDPKKDAFSVLGIDKNKIEQELQTLKESFLTKDEIELEANKNRLNAIQGYFDSEVELTTTQKKLLEDLESAHTKKIGDIKDKQVADEDKRKKIELANKEKGFRGLISSAARNNKALFEINKAFAIADAVLGASKAVEDAYEWGVSVAGPAGGAIAGGLAAAATAVNIASIASSSFGGGGSASSAGGGGGSVESIAQSSEAITGSSSSDRTINVNVDEDSLITPRVMIDLLNKGLEDGNQIVLNGSAL